MKNNMCPPMGSPPITEFDTSTKKTNGPTDLFSLLHVQDGNQDRSTVPPPWATFDCKTTHFNDIMHSSDLVVRADFHSVS
jgi:hypothetical protein